MAQQKPATVPASSVIDALREILADGLRFVRAEIGLVRARGTATAKRAAFAAGLILVVAALLGWFGYLMLKKTIAEGRTVGATVKEDLEWVTRLPRQRENGS